jgi:hypothetical protein
MALESNLIAGFAYSCMDSFHNGNFNMVCVAKRSEEEIRLMESL